MEIFGKQVNEAVVDPSLALCVKKFDFDQREAAEIFGGGANAFSRYETGKNKPPLALVKLLRVLNRHPDLLAEVKMGEGGVKGKRPLYLPFGFFGYMAQKKCDWGCGDKGASVKGRHALFSL